MATIDDHGRPEPLPAAGELETLNGFLDFQRATLRWRTEGLDAEGFSRRVAASAMTLGGMLKHLTFVESYWFTYRLLGEAPLEPFRSVDWDSTPDWDWTSAADDSPEDLRAMWQAAVAQSREVVTRVHADGGLDRLLAVPWPDGTTPSLRWVLVHMIEEYARHNGHADLIREAIDGQTGE